MQSADTALRTIVEADLRRAQRLIIGIQDELDPQLRVATPTGDWAIAVTLPADAYGRRTILRCLATFMVWKEAVAFTMATELIEPDCLWCCGISRHERLACRSLIRRHPRPWSEASFTAIEWMASTSIDTEIANLLPQGPRALTPKEVSAMITWFGVEGRFPAVNLATGHIGA